MKNWDLARRDLLKSLGVGAACLPLLRSSKLWAAEGAAKKLVIIHATEGYWQPLWKPNPGSLMGQTLPAASSPLEPHKADLNFVLAQGNPNYTVGANWGHECYGTIYWGGPQKAPGGSKYQEPMGKTLDQMVATGLAAKTSRLTLNFQAQVDRLPSSGTTGSSRCFWTGAGQPVNPELNPAKTYQALFANIPQAAPTTPGMAPAGPDPAVKKLLGTRKSILDYVGTSLEKFKVRVGRDERAMIDGHLSSIRSLENELAGIGMGGGGTSGPFKLTNPGAFEDAAILGDAGLYPKIMDAYMDMLLAGLASGVARVATLQLGNSSGNQMNFGLFVDGIPAKGTGYKSPYYNWHDSGHNPIVGGKNLKTLIDKWYMERFAGFLTKMKAIQEPGGTMLSNSLVLWGNHMESGDNHFSQRIPWIIAGQAGGAVQTGFNLDTSGKTINNTMADICKAMGVPGNAQWTGTVGLVKA
jgi:hypothetical protein